MSVENFQNKISQVYVALFGQPGIISSRRVSDNTILFQCYISDLTASYGEISTTLYSNVKYGRTDLLGNLKLIDIKIKRYSPQFCIIDTYYRYDKEYHTYFDVLPQDILRLYIIPKVDYTVYGPALFNTYDIFTEVLLNKLGEILLELNKGYVPISPIIMAGSYYFDIKDIELEKWDLDAYMLRLYDFILHLEYHPGLSNEVCTVGGASQVEICYSLRYKLYEYISNVRNYTMKYKDVLKSVGINHDLEKFIPPDQRHTLYRLRDSLVLMSDHISDNVLVLRFGVKSGDIFNDQEKSLLISQGILPGPTGLKTMVSKDFVTEKLEEFRPKSLALYKQFPPGNMFNILETNRALNLSVKNEERKFGYYMIRLINFIKNLDSCGDHFTTVVECNTFKSKVYAYFINYNNYTSKLPIVLKRKLYTSDDPRIIELRSNGYVNPRVGVGIYGENIPILDFKSENMFNDTELSILRSNGILPQKYESMVDLPPAPRVVVPSKPNVIFI